MQMEDLLSKLNFLVHLKLQKMSVIIDLPPQAENFFKIRDVIFYHP